jgi:hypothetical protein
MTINAITTPTIATPIRPTHHQQIEVRGHRRLLSHRRGQALLPFATNLMRSSRPFWHAATKKIHAAEIEHRLRVASVGGTRVPVERRSQVLLYAVASSVAVCKIGHANVALLRSLLEQRERLCEL